MEERRSRVFIGSSREAMPYVDAVQYHLSHYAEVTPWNSAFTTNKYTMEDLEKQLDQNDYGVFICSPDDVITIRGNKCLITRDNTLFEMGLFWGKLRRGRVFFLIPNKTKKIQVEEELKLLDFHFLTDLVGINHLTYEIRDIVNHKAAVRVACGEIGEIILQAGPFIDYKELYEQATLRINALNVASKFSADIAIKLMKTSPEHIHEYIVETLKPKYGVPRGFELTDIGFWKREGSEGLRHIVGEIPSNHFHGFNVNDGIEEDSGERILVVDSYLKSNILFFLTRDNLYKSYLVCYPMGTEGVLTVTITATDDEAELKDEELDLLIVANSRLMSTIDYLFGGGSK